MPGVDKHRVERNAHVLVREEVVMPPDGDHHPYVCGRYGAGMNAAPAAAAERVAREGAADACQAERLSAGRDPTPERLAGPEPNP